MTNDDSAGRGPSEDFLAHWNAVLVAGEDMALTLGLEPLFGDPTLVSVRMALTPAIRQPAGMFSAASLSAWRTSPARRWPGTTRPPTCSRSRCSRRSRWCRTRGPATATSRSTLVSAGRRLIVTTTDVVDDTGRLLTKVDATFLVSAPRA